MVLVRCLRSETGSEGGLRGVIWSTPGELIGVSRSWHLNLYSEPILSLLLLHAVRVGIRRESSERGAVGTSGMSSFARGVMETAR